MEDASIKDFSVWLSSKLQYLKVDESVFLNYVIGILEEDETPDEKIEALTSVLVDSEQEDISRHCKEILDKWDSRFNNIKKNFIEKENMDQKLSRLLEQNVRLEETVHSQTYTPEQLKIREAILSQYGQADDPDDEFRICDEKVDNMDGIEKNINASVNHQVEKEKREQAKIESQRKKEKDKEDREKQKSAAQEKKEARRKRAQKVEHRRG